MITTSYGDMSHYTFLRARSADLKQNITTLSQEYSTGRTSDVTNRLGGDFTYVASIEDSVTKLNSYQVAVSEVTIFASSMQNSLGKVQSNVQGVRDSIYSLTPSLDGSAVSKLSNSSRYELENTISTLNASVGGRSLFSGTATSTAPLNDIDTLMSALVAEVSGLTNSADVVQAVADWFDDPAGFDAVMYNGSTTPLAPVDIGSQDEARLEVLATDPALKDAIEGLALAALVEEPGHGLSDTIKREVILDAGSKLAGATDSVITLQAEVGFVEGRIEATQTRNAAEITSLTITMNEMLEADPYETYAKLEEAQLQLESIYTITSRSFDLSLLRYM